MGKTRTRRRVLLPLSSWHPLSKLSSDMTSCCSFALSAKERRTVSFLLHFKGGWRRAMSRKCSRRQFITVTSLAVGGALFQPG